VLDSVNLQPKLLLVGVAVIVLFLIVYALTVARLDKSVNSFDIVANPAYTFACAFFSVVSSDINLSAMQMKVLIELFVTFISMLLLPRLFVRLIASPRQT
jgi:hypothetical protein